MSLVVRAVQINQGKTVPIEGAPGSKAAGFERWRTDVWASKAVTSIAQAVRRQRPSRLILPSLAAQDILVEGEELDQLEREVDSLLAHVLEVVREIQRSGPAMVAALFGGVPVGSFEGSIGSLKPVAPSEPEVVEHFRARLLNIKEAVQLAKTVPRGGVEIG